MAEGGNKGQMMIAHSGTHDVFISYASQDTAVANDVAAALEGHDIKCWIAPRDITPGAHYASEIVHAIDSAKTVVLILSQDAAISPHVLREVERATSKRHPVVTLRLDQAPLPAEFEYFLNTSQWLDASGRETTRAMPKLVAAVHVAIDKPAAPDAAIPVRGTHAPYRAGGGWPLRRIAIVLGFLATVSIGGFAVYRLWLPPSQVAAPEAPTVTVTTTAVPATSSFNPPANSIAVLPFVNMSGDPKQDYFSDGISEELLDSLSHLNNLQVAARTSSFSFREQNVDIPTIALKLNVSAIL